MAKAAGSKTKYVAGGVAVAILAAAGIAIGVTLGVKNNKSSSSDSNLKGTSGSTAAAVLEKCGALEVYSKSQDNALDGTLTDFAYGPTTASCCTEEYACPYAYVTTYSCNDGGEVIYEMQCCTSDPTQKDFSSCGSTYYQAIISDGTPKMVKTTSEPTLDASCVSTGLEAVEACSDRPTSKGVSTVSYKPAAETAEPTAAPTPKPTAKPTGAVVTVAPTALPTTPVPTKKPVVPAEDVCTQVIPPPGVKVGGCMQIVCIPQQVGAGDVFHVTSRWCTNRPRYHHSTVNLLDMTTKQYYTGSGTQPNQPYQCGEHTFQATFNANYKAGTTTYDIMWKWFVTPFWGSIDANTQYYDPFPNMLAESGINKQPTYGPLQGDCQPVPDRWWNLPPTGEQDGIDFVTIPQCIVKGKAWTIEVKVHLESALTADLRVNLQIGTGGDMYLGDKDIYVTESNKYGILPNPAVVSWDAPLPANYWTTYQMDFDADQMNLFDNGARLYIAAFLVPHLAQYNATIAGGWNVLDREYFLGLKFCNTLNEMAPAGAK